jgi:hypothetical protein
VNAFEANPAIKPVIDRLEEPLDAAAGEAAARQALDR